MAYRDSGKLSSRELFRADQFVKIGEGFNGSTISDENAIKKGYLGSSVVYSIVTRIARGVSSLPIYIYDKTNGKEIKSGEVYDFVFKPNDNQSFNEFWEQLVTFYTLTGECYNYLDAESIGFYKGQQLVLPPQAVTIETETNSIFSKVKSYKFNDGENISPLDIDYVMHVAMNNPSMQGLKTKNGLSPLQSAQNILNASNNVEIALSEYFENRGVSALITPSNEDPSMPMNDEDEKSIWSALKRKIGGAKSMNAMRFSRRALNVQQLNASSTDMQTIENKNQLTKDLCNVFGFPAMLLTGEKATYNNVKEAEAAAYNNNYIPTFEKIAAGYERKFLSKFGNYSLGIHKEKIEALNPSPTERANQAIKLVDAGLITPNEARESIGKEVLSDKEMDSVKPKGSNVTISNV